jgi:hypothetical protein
MERIVIVIFGLLIFVGMITSFYSAVTSSPEAFAIVFLLGGGVIAYFFFRGEGDWNSKSETYPPYKGIFIILGICLAISWVIGSRPTTMNDCPVSVSRWC